MYNKCFVPDVYHTADSVAGVEGGTSSRVVFYRSVVVAVLNFLGKKRAGKVDISCCVAVGWVVVRGWG